MIDITTAFCITIRACVVTYFWGKSQFNYKEFMDMFIDNLEKGGYIKTKLNKDGDVELIKLDD